LDNLLKSEASEIVSFNGDVSYHRVDDIEVVSGYPCDAYHRVNIYIIFSCFGLPLDYHRVEDIYWI